MPFVSITRLRLRSVRFLPAFALQTRGSIRQVRHAPGFLGGSLLPDRDWTFWTMTAWDGRDSMRRILAGGSHRTAMPRLLDWCDEASVTHWDQDDDALPSWTEAERRMRETGRISKVRNPSPQHAALAFRAARTSRAAPILPA